MLEQHRRPCCRARAARSGPSCRRGDGQVDPSDEGGSVVRIEAAHPEAGEVRAFLRVGARPLGRGGLPDRRRRVRVDAKAGRRAGRVRRAGRRSPLAGRGARGRGRVGGLSPPPHRLELVGRGRPDQPTGASVGWNLVSGINDPPERSERAIWVDGEPSEPGPVSFDGPRRDRVRRRLAARVRRRVRAATGGEPPLRPLLLPPAVRQPSPARSGRARARGGLGVMEHHDAHW